MKTRTEMSETARTDAPRSGRSAPLCAPGLEMWSVDRPRPYPGNPRRNDAAVDAVAESIRAFGWGGPIVVDGDGVIVCGHTRLKAARKLGLATVPVLVRADLTPEQAAGLRLADNRTGEIADWDNAALDAELEKLADADFDMAAFGFEESEDSGEEREAEPPARITSPLDERHEYVVLVCDNAVDWEQAKTVFGLGIREGFRLNRKNRKQEARTCFSRVVSWAEFARRFLDD